MMKQHVTEASLQESYKALGLQLMVSKKIILCTVKLACKTGFTHTKEVHSYVYAYVLIWLNQLCHSSFPIIHVLWHRNV